MRLSDLKRQGYIASTLQSRHQKSSRSQVKAPLLKRGSSPGFLQVAGSGVTHIARPWPFPSYSTACPPGIMDGARLSITDISPSWMYSLYIALVWMMRDNHKTAAWPSAYKVSEPLEPTGPRFAAARNSSAPSCGFGPWIFVLFLRKLWKASSGTQELPANRPVPDMGATPGSTDTFPLFGLTFNYRPTFPGAKHCVNVASHRNLTAQCVKDMKTRLYEPSMQLFWVQGITWEAERQRKKENLLSEQRRYIFNTIPTKRGDKRSKVVLAPQEKPPIQTKFSERHTAIRTEVYCFQLRATEMKPLPCVSQARVSNASAVAGEALSLKQLAGTEDSQWRATASPILLIKKDFYQPEA